MYHHLRPSDNSYSRMKIPNACVLLNLIQKMWKKILLMIFIKLKVRTYRKCFHSYLFPRAEGIFRNVGKCFYLINLMIYKQVQDVTESAQKLNSSS